VTLGASLCGVIGSHVMLMTMTLHKMRVIYGTCEHIWVQRIAAIDTRLEQAGTR
jgi:hypothetical protein